MLLWGCHPELQSSQGLPEEGSASGLTDVAVGGMLLLAGCWAKGLLLEAALTFLSHGLLQRVAHNMAAYFERRSKGEEPKRVWKDRHHSLFLSNLGSDIPSHLLNSIY